MKDRENKYVDKFLRGVKQHHVLLLAICVLFILRPKFLEWIKDYLCPLTPIEIDNNGWVLGVIILAIIIAYAVSIKRLWSERELLVSRIITLSLLFAGWCIFRYANEFKFYGIDGWRINYIECAWITIGAIELVLFFKRLSVGKMSKGDGYPFYTDTPVLKDDLDRKKYAVQLVKKIQAAGNSQSDGTDGAFAILINEHYGVGKTSFLLQLQQIAENAKVEVCWFKPWLYDDNKSMILNFIQVIKEKLGTGDGALQHTLSNYARILSSMSGYEMFSFLRHEESSVESQFEEIKNRLDEKKRPIIVMIDDVDRLQGEELLQMLQMIRNMGDFPYLYYVISGDKNAIQNRLAEEKIGHPEEFLKKFFNLEMCFPADDGKTMKVLEDGLTSVMEHYGKDSEEIWQFIQNLKYRNEIFANIRDIKRYLNVLDYTLGVFQTSHVNMLDEISLRDLAGLCIIENIDSEFYKLLRDHNDYVLEFKDWHLKLKSDFKDVFTDRYTKKIVHSAAVGVSKNKNDLKDPVSEEISQVVHSLADVVEWSVPTKAEVIGEILGVLFPQSHASESRIGICHPTEFFKYFSAVYRGTEISNAEIIGIMKMDKKDYASAVYQIIQDKKLKSFKNKLLWYLQSNKYDRLPALEKVMKAFDMEMRAQKEDDSSYRETIFMQQYGTSVYAIFASRQDETEEQRHGAWEIMRKWLVTSPQYEWRILILDLIANHFEDYSAYIFETKENVKDCVLDSEKQFINDVWLNKIGEPGIYQYIKPYREIEPKISEFIINGIIDRKMNEVFLLQLVKYVDGGLQWNKEYIDAVLGTHRVFGYESSLWLHILPKQWKEEFIWFNMQEPIDKGEIEKSNYLQHALRYWKNQLELSDKEKERLAYVLNQGCITEIQYAETFSITRVHAQRELNKMVRLGKLEKDKDGTRVRYIKPETKL